MNLSHVQFDERSRDHQLVVTVFGMSNVGKSYWSRALENMGWHRIWADGRLHRTLERAGLLRDATDEGLARWLGMPYEEGFADRQRRLLELEAELFWEIAHELEVGEIGNTVMDPGGSFIYAGAVLCEAVQARSLMVYVEATPQMHQEMFERFIAFPKALLWPPGSFEQRPGEHAREALARCYSKLLETRAQTYAKYADVTIPYSELPRDGNGKQFLEAVRARLP